MTTTAPDILKPTPDASVVETASRLGAFIGTMIAPQQNQPGIHEMLATAPKPAQSPVNPIEGGTL